MGAYVAQRLVKLLIAAERPIKTARVGILGLTFKEDVPDLRNSRVPDIIAELRGFGVHPMVHDPMADPAEARQEYGLELVAIERFGGLDGVIYAVPHRMLKDRGNGFIAAMLAPGGVLVDVKSAVDRTALPGGITYSAL